MSDKIKPSEVSQVLLEQLEGISGGEQFDEVGSVLQVSDGVARIYGLRNAEASELLEFENGTMGIVMNLEEDNVGCVLLGPTSEIKEGMHVKRTKRIASIKVNDNMLGRVINPLGQAIDGKGDIDLNDSFEMPLDRKAPGVIYRQPVKEPLQTGLKVFIKSAKSKCRQSQHQCGKAGFLILTAKKFPLRKPRFPLQKAHKVKERKVK